VRSQTATRVSPSALPVPQRAPAYQFHDICSQSAFPSLPGSILTCARSLLPPPRRLQAVGPKQAATCSAKIKVGINGFGRIGRNVLRCWHMRGPTSGLEIVAINDSGGVKQVGPAAHCSPMSAPLSEVTAVPVCQPSYLKLVFVPETLQIIPTSVLDCLRTGTRARTLTRQLALGQASPSTATVVLDCQLSQLWVCPCNHAR
jgi:hypothetical protein